MIKRLKKFVAIATLMASIMMVAAPSPAYALTADELAEQIATLQAQLAALTAQLGELEGDEEEAAVVVEGCDISSFDRNLKEGMSGDDVKCLQIVLNSDTDTVLGDEGAGSPGNETSYFGPITKAGVIKFQEKYADEVLASWGLTAGTGFVGSTSRTKLDELLTGGAGEAAEEEEEEAAEEGEQVVIPTSGIAVSLSANTPVATTIAGGSTNVAFAKINFTAAEDSVISSIAIKRTGLAYNADITAVRLWEGSVQVGGTQALNSTTYKATFGGLNWSVPAGTTKTLTVTADMQTITGGGTAGNTPILGIFAATDVVADKTVSGTFPIVGKSMTLAGISVGYLDVDLRAIPANRNPLSGSVDQEMASWTFTASSTEGFSVTSIKFTQIGSAGNTDVSNLKIKVLGEQVGTAVASLAADSTVTFDLSASPIIINSGASKVIYLYCDVAAGIVTSRTVQFEIGEATHVTAFGSNSAGAVTITKTAGTHDAYTTQQSVAQTVSQSSGMTVTMNGATNPSAKAFVNGTSGQLISAFRFSAGSEEDLRVARLRLSLGGTNAGAVDLSNVILYKYDEATAEETQIDSATNFVGSLATWGADSTGLDTGIFDVPKSSHVVVHVRADISSSADYTTLGIYVNEVKVDGIMSQGNLTSTLITIGAVDGLADVTNHTTNASVGTIVMTASPSTPAATSIVPGTTDHHFLSVDFTPSGEDIILSSLTVNLYQSIIATKTVASSGDFVNVKLWDGDTQLGTTNSSPVTTATFSFNLVLTKDITKTLKVTADIPSDTVSASRWSGSDYGSIGMDADLYATGVYSGTVLTDPSSDADGKDMLALAEVLTVNFQTVSPATKILNESGALLARVLLTANTAGDIRVSSMRFAADTNGTLTNTGTTDVSGYVGTLKLYDGSTQVGTVKSGFAGYVSGSADAYVQFTGLSITIPKGTQKVIDLKGNVLVGGSVTINIGMVDITGTTSNIVGTGLSSNATVYGAGSDAADSGQLTLSNSGSLTVDVGSDTPVSAHLAIGANGVSDVVFSKFKFAAVNEPVVLEALTVTLEAGTNEVPDIAAIHLYNGSTEVSTAGYLTGTNAATAVEHTFYMSGLTVPKDDSITLTLKADLNGTSTGATSKHTPRFYLVDVTGAADLTIADLKATGASSGATVTSSAGTSAPETVGNFGEMTLLRTKPVFSASAPAQLTLNPLSSVKVLTYTVSADVGGDVIFAADNTTFTVSGVQGGGATDDDIITVKRADNNATVGTKTASNGLDAGATIAVPMTDTIAAGTSRTYNVYCDLQDYGANGDTFQLSIEDTTGHVIWDDGTTAGANVSDALMDGLPVAGNAFVNPS